MDPFVFDQKFARFVSQLGSEAMRRGTELYEEGKGTLRGPVGSRFAGSVVDGKQGVFSVTIAENDDGGFSGSCDCDVFFNCGHSYAIARLARDQVMGRSGGIAVEVNQSPKPEVTSKLRARLRVDASAEEKRVCGAVDRLWAVLERRGFLLYPKDLAPFLESGPQNGLIPGNPVRPLKKLLESAALDNSLEFADALKCYFEYKEIRANEAFAMLANSDLSKLDLEEGESKKQPSASWSDEALLFRYELSLEPAAEKDWFQLSAKGVVEGGGYSEEEVELLLAAKGKLVNLPDKGWRRMNVVEDAKLESIFAAMGIDPSRRNSQRIHAVQLEDLLSGEVWEDSDWLFRPGSTQLAAIDRARELQRIQFPEIPTKLSGVLRPYQVEGFHFLCRLSALGFGGILADDMGLGKTLQTLAWMLWQKEGKSDGEGFRALVVCPKSVAENWIREPDAFETGMRSELFRAKDAGQEELIKAEILVANYAQLRIHADHFLSEEWDAVVLDEGQNIKSPSSQTTKTAWKLKAKQRLVLSGTPIENRVMDLWSIMRFAMPRLLGPQAAFAANYNLSQNPEALDGLRRRIQPFMLRRLKSEVARDLPDRIEEEIYCELEGAQRKLYEQELESARSLLRAERGGEQFNALQALLRMRQICCDPKLLAKNEDSSAEKPIEFERSSKVEAVLDIVEPLVAEGHKVLVFSQFVSMLEIIEHELNDLSIPSLKLTGKTQNRRVLVDRFQNEKTENVFLLSLKAAGSGLTLTAASYVILVDPWWNPAVEAQAIDRTHRIGQENKVIAYRILAKDTVEEKIRAIQKAKSDLAASVIGRAESSESLSLDEIADILG